MMKVTMVRLLCASILLVNPVLGHAVFSGITDNPNDILSTFGGNASLSKDLDVLNATVLYDSTSDSYLLSATLNGTPGTTPAGLYVWGVNTGAGTANPGFIANGVNGVRFNEVVLVQPNGTGTVVDTGGGGAGGNLPGGSITISGNTISAVVSGSLMPSTGFNKIDYTWNLWPRDVSFGTLADFSQIADFAPDNANFTTTPRIVPEPETYALLLAGLGIAAWSVRRRASR
jgi:hypothetical protein